jgi:glycosyltransferase involved in cell wall biosynthesis
VSRGSRERRRARRQASPNGAPPKVSVVIPVYNEEAILSASIADLRERLAEFDFPSYEIILAENGSRDATIAIAAKLSEKHPEVRYLSLGEPNYGKALREGIRRARGEFVICDEIDLCDVDFYRSALWRLENEGADMVVGSKVLAGARDERPLFRHVATLVFNGLLRVSLGFKGTDTHGLKAFRREKLLPVVDQCLVDKDVFASEFVIRAERGGYRIMEVPVRVIEKRPPSINLVRRVPNVLKNLGKLFAAIRLGRPPSSGL